MAKIKHLLDSLGTAAELETPREELCRLEKSTRDVWESLENAQRESRVVAGEICEIKPQMVRWRQIADGVEQMISHYRILSRVLQVNSGATAAQREEMEALLLHLLLGQYQTLANFARAPLATKRKGLEDTLTDKLGQLNDKMGQVGLLVGNLEASSVKVDEIALRLETLNVLSGYWRFLEDDKRALTESLKHLPQEPRPDGYLGSLHFGNLGPHHAVGDGVGGPASGGNERRTLMV